jgi:O-antigen/teichoic acid export membrane protein
MSIATKAARGTIWLTGVQIGITLFSFGANVVLARLLMPEDFGTFALALSLTELFFILAGWSFGLAVVQTKELSEDFVDTGYLLSLGMGICIVIIVLGSSILLKKFYSARILQFLWIFSALDVVAILGNYRANLLERRLDYGKFSAIRLSSRVIPWIVAIFLAWLGAGVWSFVGHQVLMASILFFGYTALSGHRFRWRLSREAMRRLFRFGGQMFMARGLEVGFYRLGNLMIGTLAGTTQLGYFSQAFTLSEMGHRVSWPALGQVPFAAYSRLQNDRDKLSKGYELVNYFLFRLLTPVGLIFLFLGEQVIVFLYGEQWRPAGPLLQAFALYTLAMPVFENMKALLYSQDKIPGAIFSRLTQLSFLAPGMYLALKSLRVLGAVYVLDIGVLIGIAVIYFWVRRLVHVQMRKLALPPLLAALGTFAVWRFGIAPLHQWQPVFKDMLAGISIICGLYLIFLLSIEQQGLVGRVRYLLSVLKPCNKPVVTS